MRRRCEGRYNKHEGRVGIDDPDFLFPSARASIASLQCSSGAAIFEMRAPSVEPRRASFFVDRAVEYFRRASIELVRSAIELEISNTET